MSRILHGVLGCNPRTEAAAILDSGLELGVLNFVAAKGNSFACRTGLLLLRFLISAPDLGIAAAPSLHNDEWPACRWSWHLSPPLPVVIFNSGCPRFWLMLNLFLKNLEEKFGAKEKVLTFAVPSETHWFHEHGSLAQLVQSVCLTSRGSGVRLPQLPPQRTRRFSGSFFCFPVIHGVQLWPLSLCSEEETSDNEQVYFHIGKSN